MGRCVTSPQNPRVESFTLPNGLDVALLARPQSPVVSSWVWYRVGSKNETPGATGAAHWLEHMLFKGSRNYAVGAIDRAIVEAGGNLNAFTDTDFTAYFITVPRQHALLPLRIESDRMTGATIPAPEVDKEREVVLSEREMNENHPVFRVEEEIFALAFHEHPYHWDPLGYAQDIRRITRDELYRFYRRFYGPANASLVLAGGFDPGEIRREIQKRFGAISHETEDPRVPTEEPPQRGERRTTLRGPGSTPLVRIGWRVPSVLSPTAARFLMLDLYLGGEIPLYPSGTSWGRSREHPSARLYQALVDTGLAVSAGSDWRPRVHPSLFSVWAQAAPGVSLDRLEEAVRAEVDRVRRRRVDPGEMARLRAKLVQGARMGWEGSTRSGFRLGYFWALGGRHLDRSVLRECLRLSPGDIREAAEEIFQDDRATVVRYEVEPPPPDGRGRGSRVPRRRGS